MDSEEWNDIQNSQDSFEVIETLNIHKIESEHDGESIVLIAEDIFNKMKFYCDYHGLNLLNVHPDICIRNLIHIL